MGCQDCWGILWDLSGAMVHHCDGPLASTLQQQTRSGRPGAKD